MNLAKLLFGSFGSRRHDRWKKDSRFTPPWHNPAERPDTELPPNRYHCNWKSYNQYWQTESKAAFEAFMNRIEKEGRKEGRKEKRSFKL